MTRGGSGRKPPGCIYKDGKNDGNPCRHGNGIVPAMHGTMKPTGQGGIEPEFFPTAMDTKMLTNQCAKAMDISVYTINKALIELRRQAVTDSDPKYNENLINQYIKNDENEKAVDLLYKLAIQCAKNKDFVNAEAYRDRLYEVDSMALTRIVEVNEVIEAAKLRTLTPDLRRMWAPFFQGLTAEEAGSFYFALKEQQFDGDQIILQQGATNDRLYLAHQGKLKVVYQDKEMEMLIQRLGAGDIFGQDTFFSVNVCTSAVKTLSAVKVSYLEYSSLEKLAGALKVLESNLLKISTSGAATFELMQKRGIDRRSYRRITMQTKVSVQLLSSDSDAPMRRPLTAELWDISKIGLSFYFRSKSRDTVRRLVGRTLGVSFSLLSGAEHKDINVTGVVQGVDSHPLEEYSVHLKLNRSFSDRTLQMIQSVAAQNDGLR
jgi:CRP-like cAMP-binding protein